MSKQELYKATLRKLGVLDADATPSDADTTICAEAWEELATDLGISSAYIPNGAGLHIANVLAADLCDDFQVDEMRVQRFLNMRQRNIHKIMSGVNQDYDYPVIEGDFY